MLRNVLYIVAILGTLSFAVFLVWMTVRDVGSSKRRVDRSKPDRPGD